jgi:hypothetical protein
MSAELLRRAAQKLRDPDPTECCNPYRCSADRGVDLAVADLLERVYVMPRVAVMPSIQEYAEAVARAVLREPDPSGGATDGS